MAKLLWALFLLVYIVPSLFFYTWVNSFSEWAVYGAEVVYVVASCVALKAIPRVGRFSKSSLGLLAAMPVIGALLALICSPMNIAIPFDLSVGLTWVLLIAVAPVLEELLFRQALWELTGKIHDSKVVRIVSTAVLFSAAHAVAYYHVPLEFRDFVAYQALYTLVLGLIWGWARSTTDGLLMPVLMHALLNAAFGLGALKTNGVAAATTAPSASAADSQTAAASARPKILVVDMPIRAEAKWSAVHVFEGSETAPITQDTCAINADNLETLMKAQLQPTAQIALKPDEVQRAASFAVQVHGYHIESLLADSGAELFHVGVHAAAGPEGINDITKYIKESIEADLAKVNRALDQIQPDLVQLASSDTFEENAQDLLNAGASEESAEAGANQIMQAWKSGWSQVIGAHPKTVFVVAGGNGGLDGVSDSIVRGDDRGPLPANLALPNIVVAGSSSGDCLAPFSNSNVDVAAPGELVPAEIPCDGHAQLALNGTSQSSALVTRALAKELLAGGSLATFEGKLEKKCPQAIRAGVLSSQQ